MVNPVDIGLRIAQALDSIGIKMGSYIGKGSNVKKAMFGNKPTMFKPRALEALRGTGGNFDDALKLIENEAQFIVNATDAEKMAFLNNVNDYKQFGGPLKKDLVARTEFEEGLGSLKGDIEDLQSSTSDLLTTAKSMKDDAEKGLKSAEEDLKTFLETGGNPLKKKEPKYLGGSMHEEGQLRTAIRTFLKNEYKNGRINLDETDKFRVMEYSPMLEDDPIKVFKKIYGDEAYKKAGTFPGAFETGESFNHYESIFRSKMGEDILKVKDKKYVGDGKLVLTEMEEVKTPTPDDDVPFAEGGRASFAGGGGKKRIVQEIVEYITTKFTPMDAMKEVNKVVGKTGKYKNLKLTDDDINDIVEGSNDFIFQRDPDNLFVEGSIKERTKYFDDADEAGTFFPKTSKDKSIDDMSIEESLTTLEGLGGTKMAERFKLKQRYPGISEDLLTNIIEDTDPVHRASVLAKMDQAMKLIVGEGKGTDEAIDILKSEPKTKMATGGRAGYAEAGSVRKDPDEVVAGMDNELNPGFFDQLPFFGAGKYPLDKDQGVSLIEEIQDYKYGESYPNETIGVKEKGIFNVIPKPDRPPMSVEETIKALEDRWDMAIEEGYEPGKGGEFDDLGIYSKEDIRRRVELGYDQAKGPKIKTGIMTAAAGGRAGYYGGGQAMVEPDLSDIGHGSDALMGRTRLTAPGSQATTSTGLNYLLGEDNDNVRVPFNDGKTYKQKLEEEIKKRLKYKRQGMEFDKPLGPDGTFNTGNPPMRYAVASGGRIPFNNGLLVPPSKPYTPDMFEKDSMTLLKGMYGTGPDSNEFLYNEMIKKGNILRNQGVERETVIDIIRNNKDKINAFLETQTTTPKTLKGLADGGIAGLRQGYVGGGGVNLARRGFLKILGGTVGAVAAFKTGALKLLGKSTTKAAPKLFTAAEGSGAPAWFEGMVNKVLADGVDITKKAATMDGQTVKSLKTPTGKVDVTIDRTGNIDVNYMGDNTALGEGVDMRYVVGQADEMTKVKPFDEFEAVESIPEGQMSSPNDYNVEFAENATSDVKNLYSDTSELAELGGQKPLIKDISTTIKKKQTLKKMNENPDEFASDNLRDDFPDYDYGDVDPN